MASKTIAWADQSGDVITMTAPAWSGSQTVTLLTPENFGIARELNIVFYSESNPVVSATLNVKQAEATLALSETSLVFANDDTSEKTVTITTNMSTLDGAQLTLEGDTASDFTLSELSALSNGQATFTIKPNSANNSQDPRNVTIKLTAGRLAALSLPVTQDAATIQSVTYANYEFQDASFHYNSSLIGKGTLILASAGVLNIKGTPVRDKVTTYVSGNVERVTEPVPDGDLLYLSFYIQSESGDYRVQEFTIEVTPSQLSSGFSRVIPSLNTTLFGEESGGLAVCVSPSQELIFTNTVYGLTIQGNIRESYDNCEDLVALPAVCSKDKGSRGHGAAHISGICHYTSGATGYENVPLSFSVSMGGEYFKIITQASGEPGTEPSESKFTVETLLDNTEIQEIYGIADVVAQGGDVVGGVKLIQEGEAWGTLLLCHSSFGLAYSSITLEFNDMPTTARTLRAGEFSVFTKLKTVEIPGDVLYKYWRSIIEASNDSQVKLTAGTTTTKSYIGTLATQQKRDITQGGIASLSVSEI